MTADEQAKKSSDETLTSEENSASETQETAAPALNRAQRRAMAQGKKGASGGNPALPNGQQRGFGGSSSAKGGPARFPRTGHK